MVFQPADGVKARRHVVYDYVIGMRTGTLVTYSELGDLIGTDNLRAIQAAASQASKGLRKARPAILKAEYGVGYRVTEDHPDSFVNTASRREQERIRSKQNRMFARGKGLILKCTRDEIIPIFELIEFCINRLEVIQGLLRIYDNLNRVDRESVDTDKSLVHLMREVGRSLKLMYYSPEFKSLRPVARAAFFNHEVGQWWIAMPREVLSRYSKSKFAEDTDIQDEPT